MKKIIFFLFSLLILISIKAQDPKKISEQYHKDAANAKVFPYGNNKATGKYYDIRGIKMYVEVYGKGQPLLIIHGNSGSINNFLYQIPYFSKK